MTMNITADALIQTLGLEALPVEGGHFKQTYRADDTVLAPTFGAASPLAKPRSTAIFYLLASKPDSFSALHKLPTDEIYHFYLGDPVELLLLNPDGGSELVVLGQDLLNGQQVQFVAPAGVWQGSRLIAGGNFALLGATMAPGYVDADFRLGDRKRLTERYPDRAGLINALTRTS